MPEQDVAVPQAGAPAVADGAAPQAAAPAGDTWSMVKGFMFRMLIIYFVSSMVRQWRASSGTTDMMQPPGNGSSVSGSMQPQPQAIGRNLYHKGLMFDMYLYLSESDARFSDFGNKDALFWQEHGIAYGDWTGGEQHDGAYEFTGQIPCSEHLQGNGSLYLHVFVVKSGLSPNRDDAENYSKRLTMYRVRRLNKYKKKKYQRTQNLLTGKTDATEEELKKLEEGVKLEIMSHWHPNLTLNIVDDQTAWQRGALPPPLDEYVYFHPTGDYYPIFFFNDYWNLGTDYQPINDTVQSLNLTITYSPMSLFKWQMYASQTMRNKWTSVIGMEDMNNDDDQDSLKQAILETNPYLLGATIIVSILHTVFEILAFKNDIQFWRTRKSLEGLSVRSIVFNLATSFIVLLYIIDNETNFVVRCSVFVGLLIEAWKIPKVLDVKIDWENKYFGLIPRITFADKGTYVESATKKYDQLAFKYLGWALFPMLVAYMVYSLLYQEHRGWYSWVLSMLYGFLLTFGFIMMTPQLFINYKLKSVAHLPWRMLTYKFLNTFIDDIFAFVIKMPTMYRIGCFRDDIVFLIYVYQRYIYRVDPKRVNEFGYAAERPDDEVGMEPPVGVEGVAPAEIEANGEVPEGGDSSSSAIPSDAAMPGNVRKRKT